MLRILFYFYQLVNLHLGSTHRSIALLTLVSKSCVGVGVHKNGYPAQQMFVEFDFLRLG